MPSSSTPAPRRRRLLLERHNIPFWTIGLACSLLNLLPPAWVVLPVSRRAWCHAHYGLDALERLRAERTVDA